MKIIFRFNCIVLLALFLLPAHVYSESISSRGFGNIKWNEPKCNYHLLCSDTMCSDNAPKETLFGIKLHSIWYYFEQEKLTKITFLTTDLDNIETSKLNKNEIISILDKYLGYNNRIDDKWFFDGMLIRFTPGHIINVKYYGDELNKYRELYANADQIIKDLKNQKISHIDPDILLNMYGDPNIGFNWYERNIINKYLLDSGISKKQIAAQVLKAVKERLLFSGNSNLISLRIFLDQGIICYQDLLPIYSEAINLNPTDDVKGGYVSVLIGTGTKSNQQVAYSFIKEQLGINLCLAHYFVYRLMNLGKYEEAIYYGEKYLDSNCVREKANAQLHLIKAYFKNKNVNQAYNASINCIKSTDNKVCRLRKAGLAIELGKYDEAIKDFEALYYNKGLGYGLCAEIARLFAFSSDPKINNGMLAVKYAEKAKKRYYYLQNKGAKWAEAPYYEYIILDTLAAAYAAVHNFEKAVEFQNQAINKYSDGSSIKITCWASQTYINRFKKDVIKNKATLTDMRDRLTLYKDKQVFLDNNYLSNLLELFFQIS